MKSCINRQWTVQLFCSIQLIAITAPKALILSATFRKVRVETLWIPFGELNGTYQLFLFQLSQRNTPFFGDSFYFRHIHVFAPIILILIDRLMSHPPEQNLIQCITVLEELNSASVSNFAHCWFKMDGSTKGIWGA